MPPQNLTEIPTFGESYSFIFYVQLRYSELGYFASGQLLNICITIAGDI